MTSARTMDTVRLSFHRRNLVLSAQQRTFYRSAKAASYASFYSKRRLLANVPSVATRAPNRIDFYSDLSLFGKAVAGCVEIVTSVAFDYCMGYLSGYVIGAMLGVPKAVFFAEKTSPTGNLWKNLLDRTKQVHSKSHTYGRRWGSVSAVFGGSRTAVSVVRGNPKNDHWNEIFSSSLAGALMSRASTYFAVHTIDLFVFILLILLYMLRVPFPCP